MGFAEEKLAFNARAKASMREFLRSKTWEEKVESIERMNVAGKVAREAMKETGWRAVAGEISGALEADVDIKVSRSVEGAGAFILLGEG
jgi:hypothetical protein